MTERTGNVEASSSLLDDMISGQQTATPTNEKEGMLANEESPFVIKPKTDTGLESAFHELLNFSTHAEKMMSLARAPIEISMAYGEMQSDLAFVLNLGAIDPKLDAAYTFAAYHGQHGVDDAIKVAIHQPESEGDQRRKWGIFGHLFGRQASTTPTNGG